MDGDRRVYGLDVLRAGAILLVVVSHVAGVNPAYRAMPAMSMLGALGVEIFFVLSGFLIGGIIIRQLHANRFGTWRDLTHFWLNRWFRTLPIYYVFLLVYCALHGHPLEQIERHASYFVFMQNMAWPIPTDFFGQSWSLSVEEWFYLLFPLVLFALFAILRLPLRVSVLAAAILFLILSLALKIKFGPQGNYFAFDHSIRKFVVFRFDALMFGVLAAYLKYERPDIWLRAAARSHVSFVLFGIISLLTICGTGLFVVLPWLQLVIFPVISLTVALTMPYFAEWKKSDSLARQPMVGLAKSSYSIYLSHPIPLTALAKFPTLAGIYVLSYPLTLVSILLLGAFSYFFIESPLMALRQKWNDRFLARQPVEPLSPRPELST